MICNREPAPLRETRDAIREDAAAVTHLFRTTFAATYAYFANLHTPEEDLAHFQKVLQSNHTVVVEKDGEIAGFCAFTPGWVNYLYVLPKYQGSGIGSRLLHQAKSENAELQLWTFQQNQKARNFYERHGFKPVEETDGAGNEEKQPDVRYVWKRILVETKT
ncbi:MAG: GNAT family N-acetyltransferase [Candidatus Binatus sp.]